MFNLLYEQFVRLIMYRMLCCGDEAETIELTLPISSTNVMQWRYEYLKILLEPLMDPSSGTDSPKWLFYKASTKVGSYYE